MEGGRTGEGVGERIGGEERKRGREQEERVGGLQVLCAAVAMGESAGAVGTAGAMGQAAWGLLVW